MNHDGVLRSPKDDSIDSHIIEQLPVTTTVVVDISRILLFHSVVVLRG